MKDQQHITIRIADQPPIDLDIKRDREEMVRKTEKSVNTVWTHWCAEFSDKTPQHVLAMVAYQYAKLYYELIEKIEANEQAIENFEKQLDDILLTVK